jgi:transposase
MKLTRSSKCSLKFLTEKKTQELNTVLAEYGKVTNHFINLFWDKPISKTGLLKDVVNSSDSWLSARLKKVAAREALDMISATKERWKAKPSKMVKPVHKGNRMYVSCTIADLKTPKKAEGFDLWLELRSIGNKIGIDIPIKKHKQFNRLAKVGQRLNSYIITKTYAQFVFEIETGPKKEVKTGIGVDTGINALASLSTGEQLGTDIKTIIEHIKRCEHGSKGQQQAKRALRQRMDEVAKEVASKADLVVVEALKRMGHGSKLKRRLSKNIRRSIGTWNWKYWLKRLQMDTEISRTTFRSVLPFNTSVTCPCCGHVDRSNRDGEVFLCRSCGHTDNADINASRNILSRLLTGQYGACYKLENEAKLACPVLSKSS